MHHRYYFHDYVLWHVVAFRVKIKNDWEKWAEAVVKAVAEAKENGSEAVAKEDAAPVEEAASEETKVETAE